MVTDHYVGNVGIPFSFHSLE